MKRSVLNIMLFIAGIAVVTSMSSCMLNCVHGSGHPSTETRAVTEEFTKLDVSGAFKVILKQDSSKNISITADDNLLQYVKTKVEDGTLRVFTHKNLCNAGQMTITIGVRNLEEIKASGATELRKCK